MDEGVLSTIAAILIVIIIIVVLMVVFLLIRAKKKKAEEDEKGKEGVIEGEVVGTVGARRLTATPATLDVQDKTPGALLPPP